MRKNKLKWLATAISLSFGFAGVSHAVGKKTTAYLCPVPPPLSEINVSGIKDGTGFTGNTVLASLKFEKAEVKSSYRTLVCYYSQSGNIVFVYNQNYPALVTKCEVGPAKDEFKCTF